MKKLALQLVTVDLEGGGRGVFVGTPLILEQQHEDGQVEDVWFSNIQEVPENLTVLQLMELVHRQCCHYQGKLH